MQCLVFIHDKTADCGLFFTLVICDNCLTSNNLCFSVTGPQPDWDPDIVAALDDDFDFDNPENQLDDDFVVEANAPGSHDNKYRCIFRLSLVGLSGSALNSWSIFIPNSAFFYVLDHGNSHSFESLTPIKPKMTLGVPFLKPQKFHTYSIFSNFIYRSVQNSGHAWFR